MGLQEVVKLCKQTSEPILLRALCKVIIPMVPSPEELIVSGRNVCAQNALNLLSAIAQR